jgi:hypothetical protein
VQFCQDYRVTHNALLTTIEMGEAYLCTVPGVPSDDTIVSLEEDHFMQVRIHDGSPNPALDLQKRRTASLG